MNNKSESGPLIKSVLVISHGTLFMKTHKRDKRNKNQNNRQFLIEISGFSFHSYVTILTFFTEFHFFSPAPLFFSSMISAGRSTSLAVHTS